MDGAFYRKHSQGDEHTMWADDLYMSIPFLCRYYELTGEERYIDDAARQFLLFREYLYIPEEKLSAIITNMICFHCKTIRMALALLYWPVWSCCG